MRDLIKFCVVGIFLLLAPYVKAEPYKVLVIPDNIVTENEALDSYIYNATAEFFANEVINLLNETDYIKSPTVSEERKLLKSSAYSMIPAKNLTNRFRTTYNIDHTLLKKVANKSNARYALLITSSIDSENYILRRTVWDFLNIPGATVVDPAYKISTYAVLVDTYTNQVLWSNTFYKTISVVENRIITRGPSPQTEQLQKIRDYSRMLCPEIAQNVQLKVLPPDEYEKESNRIYYDMGNFDNVFTKKYRRWNKEGKKNYAEAKKRVDAQITSTKEKYNQLKEERKQKAEEKALQKQLDVKAEPIIKNEKDKNIINTTKSNEEKNIYNINFKKSTIKTDSKNEYIDTTYEPINIQKSKKNNLYGDTETARPPLRDYN